MKNETIARVTRKFPLVRHYETDTVSQSPPKPTAGRKPARISPHWRYLHKANDPNRAERALVDVTRRSRTKLGPAIKPIIALHLQCDDGDQDTPKLTLLLACCRWRTWRGIHGAAEARTHAGKVLSDTADHLRSHWSRGRNTNASSRLIP